MEMDRKNNGAGHQLEDVYIISAVRTPIGGYRKMLKRCSPMYLGVVATKEAIRRAGSICCFQITLSKFVLKRPERDVRERF